jgi:hypothetical protein
MAMWGVSSKAHAEKAVPSLNTCPSLTTPDDLRFSSKFIPSCWANLSEPTSSTLYNSLIGHECCRNIVG